MSSADRTDTGRREAAPVRSLTLALACSGAFDHHAKATVEACRAFEKRQALQAAPFMTCLSTPSRKR